MAKVEKEESPPMTVKQMAAMGGNARRDKLSKKRRKEIAQQGAASRWAQRNGASTAVAEPGNSDEKDRPKIGSK